MRVNIVNKGILALAAASLVLAIPMAALGADAGSIVVDPVKETVRAQAGDIVELSMDITNNTDMAKQIDIMFSEFTVDESGIPSITESADAAHTWFAAEPSQTELAAGASQEVAVTVSVPADATDKGYYVMAAVTIDSANEEAASNTTKQEIQALYSLVVGEPAESVEVSQISTADGNVVVSVDNMADVHSTVSGKLELMTGEDVVATYSIDSTNVFPGKTRNITVPVEETDLSSYTAKVSLAYGPDSMIISREQVLADAADLAENSESVTVTNTATVVSDDDEDTAWYLYAFVAAAAMLLVISVVFYAKKK